MSTHRKGTWPMCQRSQLIWHQAKVSKPSWSHKIDTWCETNAYIFFYRCHCQKNKAELILPQLGIKNYPGVIEHEKLFPTVAGRSLKCYSQTEFHLSENLRVKIVSLQFQAFKLTNGKFGKGRSLYLGPFCSRFTKPFYLWFYCRVIYGLMLFEM